MHEDYALIAAGLQAVPLLSQTLRQRLQTLTKRRTNRRRSRKWAFRYSKSELAMESPRLWAWEGRERVAADGHALLCFLAVFATP